MPTNKNAMTRYKILDDLLSNRYHNYSLDDLTEEVSKRLVEMNPEYKGVVRRTIEKDLYYLEYEGPFLVEIERYSVPSYSMEKQKTYMKQCLRYADPSFSIFKKDLSDDERYLLKEALSILGQFEGLPNLDALERLRIGLDMKENDKKIISFTKNPLQNTNRLGELFTAISQKQVVSIYYHKFNDLDNIQYVNIYPYLLKEYNRRWYIFGAAEKGGKMLCYSLDRIDKVVPLTSHKYIEYNGDINELFEDIIGVSLFEDAKLVKIYFWVSENSKNYVETKPLHDSQSKIKESEEVKLREKYDMLDQGKIFRIECKYNYELIRELSSFGKDLLVLEPSDIQDEVWKRVSVMNETYNMLRTKNS